MMKAKTLLLGLAILPLLLSCEEKKQSSKMTFDDCPVIAHKVSHNGSEMTVCDLSLVKDTFEVPINSILSTFEVVQLENSDEALTSGQGGTVTISDNYIGIAAPNGYKLFDKKGKFICTISAVGQGPDEYIIAIYDHYIDEENNRIYLLSYMARKLLVFDLAGNPQKHIRLPFMVPKGKIKVDYSKQELLIMALPFIGEGAPYVVWKQNFNGTVMQYIESGHFAVEGDYSNDVECLENTDNLDYSAFYLGAKKDSLYHYDEEINQLKPVFTAHFGDEIPLHTYAELPGHYIIRLVILSSPTYVPPSPQILIDKKTLRGTFVQWKYKSLGNIDGPNWIDFRRGYFTANMYPHDLKQQLEKALARPENLTPEVRDRIRKLNNSITEDDNNIIIYGKLKTFE